MINLFAVQEDASTLNANNDPLSFDSMADAEVERRLKVPYVVKLVFVNPWLMSKFKDSFWDLGTLGDEFIIDL